jgi:hypothetical protein
MNDDNKLRMTSEQNIKINVVDVCPGSRSTAAAVIT